MKEALGKSNMISETGYNIEKAKSQRYVQVGSNGFSVPPYGMSLYIVIWGPLLARRLPYTRMIGGPEPTGPKGPPISRTSLCASLPYNNTSYEFKSHKEHIQTESAPY